MYLKIRDISYFVEVKGDGFPLVLLHGFTGDGTTWNSFVKQWSHKRTCICIDIIGHGKTDSPEDINRYKIQSVVKDIKSILENLKLDVVDVLGYSMGGRLALSFAMEYPEKVRKLVLESSSPGLKTEEERNSRQIQDERLANQILEHGIEEFVHYWENIPLFSSQKELPLQEQQMVREQRLQNSLVGLSNSLKGMGTGVQPSYWDKLSLFEIETLLVTGALDEKFCLIAEEMVASMKKAQWVKVDGCGHAIHVEHSEKFGTIVNGFLSR
jgi:2-succinyl-6-hydroxy-2,4-cyclohexadiene-1-carboxylate synthase